METRSLALLSFATLVTAACSPDAPLAPHLRANEATLDVGPGAGPDGQQTILLNYADGFESASFRPIWSTSASFGSVTLNQNPVYVHSGLQSVQFSSSQGGQRDMHLRAHSKKAGKGTVSVYFYDFQPGVQTLYQWFILSNSTGLASATLGVADYDANCYIASFIDLSGVQSGPNQNCGIFPQLTTTNVARTPGWHQLKIVIGATSVEMWIDQNNVFTAQGDYKFDSVDMTVSGPFWRPDTFAYFDDFQVGP